MLKLTNFKVHIDGRDVLTATLNVPERPMNVFDESVLRELDQIVEYVRKPSGIPLKMLVFRSGKPAGFLAGADIHRLKSIQTREECQWILEQGQFLFNRLEALPIPTLALIHGPCVGGGLEFALACKYRLAVNLPSTRLGLPEVKLGLIPGWGGTQRLPRKVGLSTALPMLLQGKLLTAKQAAKAGLVNRAIEPDQIDAELDSFITRRLDDVPVRKPSRTMSQWLIDGNPIGRSIALSQARRQIEKPGRHYPALQRILEATEVGLASSRVSEEGLRAERSAFCDLILGSVAPHLIDLFLNQEQAKKASTWTDTAEPLPVKKIAVIGAGTMGAGIAQLAASRGYQVRLQDIKAEYVEKGMTTIRDLFKKAVDKHVLSAAESEASLKNIETATEFKNDDQIDLMIEAIIERLDVKEELFRTADNLLPANAVLASNTSALSIDGMAKATNRPEKVAGLHFFNPVHKMPLVEVVKAQRTSDETLATLVGVAKKLGKVPVVVKQSPGFLVNRILFPYLDEAARLVIEGYTPKEIDDAAVAFGMPMGPLELLDVIGIDIAADVSQTLLHMATEPSPSPELFASMVKAGHKGQKSGRGFYHWKEGKKQAAAEVPLPHPSSGKKVLACWTTKGEELNAIQQRLVLALLNEAQKCLNEKVVAEPWMIDLGMVLGTGFAPFRGGPMSCIQDWGPEHVRERLQMLSRICGPRFEPAISADPLSDRVRDQRVTATPHLEKTAVKPQR